MSSPSQPEAVKNIPTHIAIIMDGNGRWAAARGLPRIAGHQAGTENLRRIISASVREGVQYLTLYAFSTENWGRPQEEVEGLMQILAEVIDRELQELHQEGVQLRHIGHLEEIAPQLQAKVRNAIALTKDNRRLVLNLAFNYGGRDEIVCAIRKMISDGRKAEEIDTDLVSQYLFTAESPDPDLIIRTSGELRISNFLIWQAAYSEWYITPTLWPDFNEKEYHQAILEFSNRDRRFGKLTTSGGGSA